MSYSDRYDIAHKYFYADPDEYFYPRYSTCGYDGNRFFSYNTLIGLLLTARNGRRVFLYSINNFSVTTARHISAIRQACPVDEIPVFMEYGERDGTTDKFARRALENMDYYSAQKLTQRANRDGFLTAFNSFQQLAAAFKLSVKMPAKYKELAGVINDSAAVKAYQARAAERAKRAEVKRRAALKKLIKGRSLSELAMLAYSTDSELDAEQRAGIRDTINPDHNLSFVWVDKESGDFKTSQYITMPRAEGLAALKLWAAGKLKHGLTVGRYTVLEVTPEIVKIGCHRIPVENLRELITC